MKSLIFAASLSLLAPFALAADLAISPADTYAKVSQDGDRVLFLDVRDPVEIMFVGFTDEVDVNLPYLIADRTRWNAEKGVFLMAPNPDFLAQVDAELKKRGLDRNAEIITMCRSGSERGAPSAELLRASGFPNARFVEHGFQGDVIKEGPQAGWRQQNGWQNSGLPWSPKMNPDKIYRTDRP